MFDKSALEFLVDSGETKVIEVEGQQYSTKQIYRVNQPSPAALKTTTLTALINYIKSGMDEKFSKLIVHVVSPRNVALYSELRSDEDRECYLTCEALLPSINLNRFVDAEDFNIMLQSNFVENDDKTKLLKITGSIRDDVVKEFGDNGVAQSVTVKAGVASVAEVVVPNPVILAPYRSFPEIEQPASRFIFRMQSGPTAAIFEADGGAWRNVAMARIKDYLEENLKEFEFVSVIS